MNEKLLEKLREAIKEGSIGIVIYANDIAYNEISPKLSSGEEWYYKVMERLKKNEEAVVTSTLQGGYIYAFVALPVKKLENTTYFFEICQKYKEKLDGPVVII